jgi:YggT family protein
MSGFTVVGFFLISLFFGLIIFSLWIRLALRYYRISSVTPMSHLIHHVTDPMVNPFNLIYKPKAGQLYDWPAFIVLVLIEFIKMICLSLLLFHTVLPFFSLIIFVVADLIIQPCNLLFYAIFIRVIMSYINPAWSHPVADFLRILTEPLLKLGRKMIPNIAGFDFTLFISASLPGNLL